MRRDVWSIAGKRSAEEAKGLEKPVAAKMISSRKTLKSFLLSNLFQTTPTAPFSGLGQGREKLCPMPGLNFPFGHCFSGCPHLSPASSVQ
jgi:hypothetical protein